MSISLTEQESSLFSFLLETLEENGRSTVIRVAGGWVRDKLLGKESNDIDIALDDMMGKDFAEMINDKINNLRIAQDSNYQPRNRVRVIKANVEKSKNMEVAMIKVQGIMLDITNLRNAEYTIGTPLEDAMMRDVTINSLFFNVNESKVEDFTGKGFSDLMAGRIQTPSDPVWTFKDDAVRLLRAIRFSSRFQFEIDP